ncbi:MAG: hypothetical protein K1Y01_02610 [Vicinamibacteria bacterium]|nr:hypothetical protein [Vicinamibacteria bacterium]
MSARGAGSSSRSPSFEEACASIEAALSGAIRQRIVDEVSKARTFDRAARRLRDGMRVHAFEADGAAVFSGRWVKALEQRTRQDGFHALNDWDGKADRFNDDIIPVEVANFVERMIRPADAGRARAALAILLDYYFMHLLGLLALRAWDEGDADRNLGEVTRLLRRLQDAEGSGQVFARDAEGLIIIATSHFEPDIAAYDRLLERVRRLGTEHRVNLAAAHAAILGCHLRFGLEVTCASNLRALRDDNVPDYPWLCEAVATLLEAYAAAAAKGDASGRRRMSEAILLGLTPDPDALLGPDPPAALAGCQEQRDRLREIFAAHRPLLLDDFEAHRPEPSAYSPFSFTFNFPHNLVKGIVVDAAFRGAPWPLSLDDLVTALPKTPELDLGRRSLATTLMGYALASPDTIRGRPHPAIVCDPAAGSRAFESIVRRLS